MGRGTGEDVGLVLCPNIRGGFIGARDDRAPEGSDVPLPAPPPPNRLPQKTEQGNQNHLYQGFLGGVGWGRRRWSGDVLDVI